MELVFSPHSAPTLPHLQIGGDPKTAVHVQAEGTSGGATQASSHTRLQPDFKLFNLATAVRRFMMEVRV